MRILSVPSVRRDHPPHRIQMTITAVITIMTIAVITVMAMRIMAAITIMVIVTIMMRILTAEIMQTPEPEAWIPAEPTAEVKILAGEKPEKMPEAEALEEKPE